MREGEKQDGKEERSQNHPKRLRMAAGENQDEKAAGTSCIEISGREMKSLEGVEQNEGVEKKTDFDLRSMLEKRDDVEDVDKILEEKQNCEIQTLEDGGKSQKSHSAEATKLGNKSVRAKGAESNDGEEEEENKRKKAKEGLKEEEGVGISLAVTVASRSVWPHLTG